MAAELTPQLDPTSALASLLSLVPFASKQQLDFSCLDPVTFATLNDACIHVLQSRSQESELRVTLSAKLREFENRIERLEQDKAELKTAADLAKRGEESAKSNAGTYKTQLDAAEAARRQLLTDVAKSRRDNQSLKAASRQAKQVNERSIARQRDRFADAAILSARNGCSRLVVIPGLFSTTGSSSGSGSRDSAHSIHQQQIAELESQRLAALASNSAMRRLCTESINALADASAALTGYGSRRLLQSELFPPGKMLRKDYTLKSSSYSHPAVSALVDAIQDNEKANYDAEKERQALKAKARANEAKAASDEDVGVVEPSQEQEPAAPKQRAIRVPLLGGFPQLPMTATNLTSEKEQELLAQLEDLRSQLEEKENDLRDIEGRMEEQSSLIAEANQRVEAAERREIEAVGVAEEEAMKLANELEVLKRLSAAKAAEVQSFIEGDDDDSISLALEPIGSPSRVRRISDLPQMEADDSTVAADFVGTSSMASSSSPARDGKRKRNDDIEMDDDASGSIRDVSFDDLIPSHEGSDEQVAEKSSPPTSAPPSADVSASSNADKAAPVQAEAEAETETETELEAATQTETEAEVPTAPLAPRPQALNTAHTSTLTASTKSSAAKAVDAKKTRSSLNSATTASKTPSRPGATRTAVTGTGKRPTSTPGRTHLQARPASKAPPLPIPTPRTAPKSAQKPSTTTTTTTQSAVLQAALERRKRAAAAMATGESK